MHAGIHIYLCIYLIGIYLICRHPYMPASIDLICRHSYIPVYEVVGEHEVNTGIHVHIQPEVVTVSVDEALA